MRTKTVTKLVRNLTQKEYSQCKSLNFRYDGCMMYDLPWSKKAFPRQARVVMIKDAETDMLIAWCLAYPNNAGDNFITQYYTRVKVRNMGYGSRLIYHVRKFAPSPVVMPHDPNSRAFCRKHEDKITVRASHSLY